MQSHTIFVQFLKRFLYYYPLTLTGSLLFLCGIMLLGDALISFNPFSFILGVFALVSLLALGVLGRVQVAGSAELSYEWDSTAALYAGSEEQNRIHCEGLRLLPFFRLHFSLRGRLYVAEKESFYYMREFSGHDPAELRFPLYFPLCGSFKAAGSLRIKDVFGLTRARFTPALPRTLIVRPPLILREDESPTRTMDGLEDTIRKKDTSEERYYQREYMAGDKLRDINWKTSGRIATLITKVSHITQEKTRLLTVFFQNYRKQSQESMESVVHLNVMKGWLLSFIKAVKKTYPDYNFEVITNQDKFTIETVEDIDRFSLALGTIHYHSLSNNTYLPHPGEVFIFTTPFDTQLPRLIASLAQSKLHIFRTAVGSGKARNAAFSLLKPLPSLSFPGLWVLRREKNHVRPVLLDGNTVGIEEINVTARLL
jgi:hypothetical protein